MPTLAVTLALNDGGGNVDSVPVAVYCGSAVTLPAGTLVIDVGGHTKFAVAEGAIVPASTLMVINGWYEPSKGLRLSHLPSAVRGP